MASANDLDNVFDTLRATEPCIEDRGFSSAVLARLPETERLPAWLSNLIILGFTALGSALAAWLLPVAELVTLATASLQSLPSLNLVPIIGMAAGLAFILSYVVVWLAQSDTI